MRDKQRLKAGWVVSYNRAVCEGVVWEGIAVVWPLGRPTGDAQQA